MNEPVLPVADEVPREPAPAGAPDDGRRLEYDGARGPLAKIAVSNALLTLATLGVYRFWGKTRVRRYLWSRSSFLGDRAEYTGTGGELFLGFVAAIAVLALVAAVPIGIEWTIGLDHPVYWAAEGVYALVIVFLVFVAEYRARRYRLSRSEWRGIRFAQAGSSVRYALLALGWGAVNILTLGTAYAVYRTRLQRYRTTHTSFGDRGFEFEGRALDLLKIWLLAWLLLLPTLGLTYVWYRAREFRYFAGKSRCGALSFTSDLRTGAMIRVALAFVLCIGLVVALLFATLLAAIIAAAQVPGLAGAMERIGGTLPAFLDAADLVGYVLALVILFPIMAVLRVLFLIHPLFRHVLPSIQVFGEEDYAAIAQSVRSRPRRGEGLADALDVGTV